MLGRPLSPDIRYLDPLRFIGVWFYDRDPNYGFAHTTCRALAMGSAAKTRLPGIYEGNRDMTEQPQTHGIFAMMPLANHSRTISPCFLAARLALARAGSLPRPAATTTRYGALSTLSAHRQIGPNCRDFQNLARKTPDIAVIGPDDPTPRLTTTTELSDATPGRQLDCSAFSQTHHTAVANTAACASTSHKPLPDVDGTGCRSLPHAVASDGPT